MGSYRAYSILELVLKNLEYPNMINFFAKNGYNFSSAIRKELRLHLYFKHLHLNDQVIFNNLGKLIYHVANDLPIPLMIQLITYLQKKPTAVDTVNPTYSNPRIPGLLPNQVSLATESYGESYNHAAERDRRFYKFKKRCAPPILFGKKESYRESSPTPRYLQKYNQKNNCRSLFRGSRLLPPTASEM